MIRPELQRPRHRAVEQFGKPLAAGAAQHRARQFDVHRAIGLLIFQLLLPILLIQQSIKLTQFATRIVGVYQSFLQLFNDIKQTQNFEIKQPEMLKIVLDYQTTLAWGGVLLDSNLFEKNNPKLSEAWEQMKRLYKIEDH